MCGAPGFLLGMHRLVLSNRINMFFQNFQNVCNFNVLLSPIQWRAVFRIGDLAAPNDFLCDMFLSTYYLICNLCAFLGVVLDVQSAGSSLFPIDLLSYADF